MSRDKITIFGAREHNLKNISIELPREKMIVITGPSGSGKSSLAFDTIYAEGQRRYVESLSAYARQFLEQMEKPDIDHIDGLSPAISIEQKTVSKNPRSTVATVTETYDYLRLLYARIGKVYCYRCHRKIESQSVQQIVDSVTGFNPGTKIQILSPIVRGRKGEYKKELDQLRTSGYVRVRIDSVVTDLSEDIILDKNKKHNIEVIIDRLILKEGIETRLADSVETALKLSEGILIVWDMTLNQDILFSEHFACIKCGISYPELTPRMFSFNNPYGACAKCDGLGTMMNIDPDLIVPDKTKSLKDGVIAPWEKKNSIFHYQMLEALSDHFEFDLRAPFEKLSSSIQKTILYGSGTEDVKFFFEKGTRRHFYFKPFEGVIPNLKRRYLETDSSYIQNEISQYMNSLPCPQCKGSRLRKESRSVKVGGKKIEEVTKLSVKDALCFFNNLSLTSQDELIGKKIIKEIKERLTFLANVGLDYLTLNRTSGTLSGGEGQRIRLATQIGSSLVGVLYILDEPSIGLHQRDNAKLLSTLKELRDIGNTVIVVEHDAETILSADFLLDLGPGAGVHGGEIVSFGSPKHVISDNNSLTGKYLSGKLTILTPKKRRQGNKKHIEILGASQNNLKNINVSIPLGKFTCITGVSGSGKSTLIFDILYRALAHHFWKSSSKPGQFRKIKGLEHIDNVIDIDQSPIGRTPRSNPATYTGSFTLIRELFSQLPESKKRGYKMGRFSFNIKGGRCETCEGEGTIKIEMHFLPDIYINCEQCNGHRFNRETLQVKYKGKNIADVLEMTVNQAIEFFSNIPKIKNKMNTLYDVGLGYIKLGQTATTLSGGEAQRIKLSKELSKRSTGNTLYILDEPTTGLHFSDVKKLLDVLTRLTDVGNTIVVIEHNLDVIKTADHIIDLGPEGGDKGGTIVAQGTPEQICKIKNSFTGQFLKKVLVKS